MNRCHALRVSITALAWGLAGWLGGSLVFNRNAAPTEKQMAAANRIEDRSAHALKATGALRSPSPEIAEWRKAALEELNKSDPNNWIRDSQESQLERLLRDMFDADPAGTLDFLQHLQPRSDGTALAERLLPNISPGRFPIVKEWIAQLPRDGFHCRAVHAVMRLWRHTDPEGLAAEVRAADGTPYASLLRASFLSDLAPLEKIAFIQTLPQQEQKAFWIDPRPEFSSQAPARAAEEIVRVLGGPEQEKAARQLFSNWAEADPISALTTAHALPGDTLQYAVASDVVRVWSSRDSFQASKFATALPPGTLRDAAAAGLALELANTDSDAAAQWAASITDSARRAEILNRIQESGAKSPDASPSSQ